MANFNVVVPILDKAEGGKNSNPRDNAANYPAPDSGGVHTNRGITYRTFIENAAKFGYVVSTPLFLQMPDKIRNEIAKRNYWDVLKLDKINSNKKAYLLFDFAFNSGTHWPIVIAQELLGIPKDGIAGTQFVDALNNADEDSFGEKITAARVLFIQNSSRIHESLKAELISRVLDALKKNCPMW